MPLQFQGQDGLGLPVDSAFRGQGNDGLDDEPRLDIAAW